jgi:hypothetical protein
MTIMPLAVKAQIGSPSMPIIVAALKPKSCFLFVRDIDERVEDGGN